MKSEDITRRSSILRDTVYSANDGVITTFAVIAGSVGASFDTRVIIILGMANLVADGFSMATGNYLGTKSQQEFEKSEGRVNHSNSPIKQALVTFVSFMIAGFIPLIPYLFLDGNSFRLSAAFVGLTLFMVGASRSMYTKKGYVRSGFEMLIVGGAAACLAFVTGRALDKYIL